MKKIYILFATVLMLCSFSAVAQTFPANALEQEPPRLLVHGTGLFSGADSFQFYGQYNVKLSHSELYDLLQTVPGNDVYIQKAKGWHTAMWIFRATWIASLVTSCVYEIADVLDNTLPGHSIVVPVCAHAYTLGIVGALGSHYLYDNRLLQAADHYNVYILGLPIK